MIMWLTNMYMRRICCKYWSCIFVLSIHILIRPLGLKSFFALLFKLLQKQQSTKVYNPIYITPLSFLSSIQISFVWVTICHHLIEQHPFLFCLFPPCSYLIKWIPIVCYMIMYSILLHQHFSYLLNHYWLLIPIPFECVITSWLNECLEFIIGPTYCRWQFLAYNMTLSRLK